MMKNWDKLRVFYYVAQGDNYTQAEDRLNVSQPALSRSIQLLEYYVKAQLFDRHPRGITLTPKGRILFEAVSKASALFEEAEIRFQEWDKPQGKLILLTPVSCWLLPYLQGFFKDYPDITLQITEHVRETDTEDVMARICPLSKREDIIQKPLITFYFRFYGHPDYLQAKGTPCTLEELRMHRLLLPHPDTWPLAGVTKELPAPCIQMRRLESLKSLAEQGAGLALLPHAYAKGSGLVPLSLDREMPALALYYSYAKSLSASKRITALRDHLEKSLAQERGEKIVTV